MSEPPKRAFSITIQAGADTKECLLSDLHEIIDRIQSGASSEIMGGSTSGYHFKLIENPEMNHEAYMRKIYDHINEDKSHPDAVKLEE